MVIGTRSTDPRASLLREVGAGTACLLAVTAALQLAAGYLPNPVSRAVAGAIGLSLVAGAVGIETDGTMAGARLGLARGIRLSLAAVFVVLAASLALGGRIEAGEVGLGTLIGLTESAAIAYRDELWLRGLPLFFARRAGVSDRVSLLYVVATGVCAVLVDPGAKPTGLLLVAASSFAYASLWLSTRDLWAAVGAHAVWRVAGDVVFAGDLLQLEPQKLPTTPGASGILAWVSALAMIGVALAVWRRVPKAGRGAPSRSVPSQQNTDSEAERLYGEEPFEDDEEPRDGEAPFEDDEEPRDGEAPFEDDEEPRDGEAPADGEPR